MQHWGIAVGALGIIVANILLMKVRTFAADSGLEGVRWWSRSLGREHAHLRRLAASADEGLARQARRHLRVEILGWVIGVASIPFFLFGGLGVVGEQASPPPWRGDFETGDLSQWSYHLNARGLSVVDGPVAEGRYAARVEITEGDLWPNGLNRVEVQHKPPPATMADERRSCFAWRFFLPAALSDARHQIGYWESYPSYKQIMSFEVRGQEIRFVTRMPTEHVHWTAPGAVTPNVWHQVALCAVWSVDPAVGAVDVWFDGQQVVTRGLARTRWDSPNLIQIGILRDVPAGPEVMFLDDAFDSPNFPL